MTCTTNVRKHGRLDEVKVWVVPEIAKLPVSNSPRWRAKFITKGHGDGFF